MSRPRARARPAQPLSLASLHACHTSEDGSPWADPRAGPARAAGGVDMAAVGRPASLTKHARPARTTRRMRRRPWGGIRATRGEGERACASATRPRGLRVARGGPGRVVGPPRDPASPTLTCPVPTRPGVGRAVEYDTCGAGGIHRGATRPRGPEAATRTAADWKDGGGTARWGLGLGAPDNAARSRGAAGPCPRVAARFRGARGPGRAHLGDDWREGRVARALWTG